ncbi:rho GTPase-activating protein 20-like [Salmo trutta]|uniref:rho GTPase-activating protein 20-like n=1 Tax=Salmo trutta TaxID=8032 RepID=UPI00113292FD|nr:rho GTPase-activating protein 20-like [Salmo trutta]
MRGEAGSGVTIPPPSRGATCPPTWASLTGRLRHGRWGGSIMSRLRRGSPTSQLRRDVGWAPAEPTEHLRSLAQRRRSAPSLAFEKALGSMPWSSIREEAPCWVSVEQCPFVLGLSSENAELVLDACVQITEGMKTRRRQLFLFSDVIAIAMLKSSASYRLKHRVSLEDLWLYGFEDEPEEEEGEGGEIDLRTSLVLAWPLAFCVVSFQ